MRILDKTVLFIYSIFAIVASFIIMVLPFDIRAILGIEDLLSIIRYMKGNYNYTLIGGIFLALSFVYLLYQFKGKETVNPGSFLVLRNEYGEVLIYQETIIGLVNNIALKFTGINNIRSKVVFIDGNISLSLKGESGNEINIPETSKELQMKVKEHVEHITGAQVSDIKIEIVNTTPTINRSK